MVGHAPPWMISDEKLTPNSVPFRQRKHYRKGTQHQARACQFNRLDGVVIVSLQASILQRPYMKYADVEVGDGVRGVVEKVCPFGLIVSVTETIRGLCPRVQVSDTRSVTSRPGKKFKEGSEVRCRVLKVDAAHRRLLLTCKKSLVRDSAKLLSDYSQAEVGRCYSGVMTSVHPYGCIVHFLGGVKGLVRKSELGLGGVWSAAGSSGDPAQTFWAGQPVECRVLECEVSTQRLLLSLVLSPSPSSEGGVSGGAVESVRSGEVVEGEVTGIASNGITLRRDGTGEVLFMPALHLSDYPHHCSILLSCHQNRLEEALKEGE